MIAETYSQWTGSQKIVFEGASFDEEGRNLGINLATAKLLTFPFNTFLKFMNPVVSFFGLYGLFTVRDKFLKFLLLHLLLFFSLIYFFEIWRTSGSWSNIPRYAITMGPILAISAGSIFHKFMKNAELKHFKISIICLVAGFLVMPSMILLDVFMGEVRGFDAATKYIWYNDIWAYSICVLLILLSRFTNLITNLNYSETDKRKAIALALIFVMMVPSVTALLRFQYDLLESDNLYGLPDEDEVIIENFGSDYYDLYGWMNDNLNRSDIILTFLTKRYYINSFLFQADSYKIKGIYDNDNLTQSLNILEGESISYILLLKEDSKYALGGGFTRLYVDHYYNRCVIFTSLSNESHFNLIYENQSFELYRIIN